MDKKQWQSTLDDMFPNGVQVTVLEKDNEIRFLTTRLEVLTVNDNVPVVQAYPVNVDKEFLFRIAELLEIDEDSYLAKQPGNEVQVLLDMKMSPESAESLRKLRAAC